MTSGAPQKARRVGRPPGPRQDPAQRREVLLDGCVQAIREHGPDVSMAELAAACGVTRPILYDHFGDRAGVAAALVGRFGGDVDKVLGAALSKPMTLRESLVEGIEFFCRFVESEPEVFRFLQAAAAHPEDVVSMESALGNRLGEVLATALRASGGDPRMGPTWAFGLLGMVFAAAEWWSQSKLVSRRALVVHLETLIGGALEAAGIADLTGPF